MINVSCKHYLDIKAYIRSLRRAKNNPFGNGLKSIPYQETHTRVQDSIDEDFI